jgi:hypothetical protein
MEERYAKDRDDWAIALSLACATVPGRREGDPRAMLVQVTEGVKRADLVLHRDDLPAGVRALALEARMSHRSRLAQLQRDPKLDMTQLLRESLSDMEKAAEVKSPGQARRCTALAMTRSFTQDRKGAIEMARRAVEAADAAAAPGGRLGEGESVLDHPWRAAWVLRFRLESRGMLVYLLSPLPSRADEVDSIVREIRALDVEDGDRVYRGKRDAAVEEIRSGWRRCAARTGERAAATQERFVESLSTLERTLRFIGNADAADVLRAEREAIEKDSGIQAGQRRR